MNWGERVHAEMMTPQLRAWVCFLLVRNSGTTQAHYLMAVFDISLRLA